LTSSSRRLLTVAASASSDWRSAEPMIRPSRILVGCWIRSARMCASSASRTRWGCRSRLHTSLASQTASFSASDTEHSRNPRKARTTLIANERPVLDQVIFVQHTRHGCGLPADGQYCPHPANSPQC
jgi:hypothetical protein